MYKLYFSLFIIRIIIECCLKLRVEVALRLYKTKLTKKALPKPVALFYYIV